jgi:hypothetical protein
MDCPWKKNRCGICTGRHAPTAPPKVTHQCREFICRIMNKATAETDYGELSGGCGNSITGIRSGTG